MSKRIRHTRAAISACEFALRVAGGWCNPGRTTAEVALAVGGCLAQRGATPVFRGIGGFPADVCVSVDDEVAHAVPGDRVLQEGDLVKVDVGARVGDWLADCAWTFVCGGAHRSPERERLFGAGLAALRAGVAAARPWARVIDVGNAVFDVATAAGVSVVKQMCGHGIGKQLHEQPPILNYPDPRLAAVHFKPGFAYSVEPILALGSGVIKKDGDHLIRTEDGQPSVHFERTFICLAQEPPWSPPLAGV